MQIQPSFWVKLRRLCEQHPADAGPLRTQVDAIIERCQPGTCDDLHRQLAALFTTLGRLPGAMDLGFRFGGRVPVTACGVMSLGILTAPTVGQALRFVAEAHSTVAPLVDFSFNDTAAEGRLTIGFRCPIDSAGEALVLALCTAVIDAEIARRSGRAGNLAGLELTASSKGTEASYRRHLSLTPHTDARSNVLIFGRAVLDIPNPHADADTFDGIIGAALERAQRQAVAAPLRDRVREAIMSGIAAPPSQERLARMLDLTPRQLRIRLEREQTSYQAIIRDCRIEYARALLRNPALSLSRIADRLGYSDLSAFSHAFQRWTGRSPSAFRGQPPLIDLSWQMLRAPAGHPAAPLR